MSAPDRAASSSGGGPNRGDGADAITSALDAALGAIRGAWFAEAERQIGEARRMVAARPAPAAAGADSSKQLRETVALLNSMVLGGEGHSETSRQMVRQALDAARAAAPAVGACPSCGHATEGHVRTRSGGFIANYCTVEDCDCDLVDAAAPAVDGGDAEYERGYAAALLDVERFAAAFGQRHGETGKEGYVLGESVIRVALEKVRAAAGEG